MRTGTTTLPPGAAVTAMLLPAPSVKVPTGCTVRASGKLCAPTPVPVPRRLMV
jgi:hypothetical protein